MHGVWRHNGHVAGPKLEALIAEAQCQPPLEHVVGVPGALVEMQRRAGEPWRCRVLDQADRAECVFRVREQPNASASNLEGVGLGGAHDHGGRVGSSVLRREMLVELLGGQDSPQIAVEAHRRSVKVEEAQFFGSVVAKPVHDIRRHEHELPRCEDMIAVRPGDPQRPVEHVEAVDVLSVHVHVGTRLTLTVAGLGQDDVVQHEPDVELAPGSVDDGDRLDHSSIL